VSLKRRIRDLLATAGYIVLDRRSGLYARDNLYTSHRHSFLDDPDFQVAYARGVKAAQGVDPQMQWRVHVALWAARTALRSPGDFVECGVNAGFISSAIMHGLDWTKVDKRYYLIDTFAGPVLEQFSAEELASGRAAFAKDAMAKGAYVTDVERMRSNFAEWANAQVVQGVIPEILPALDIQQVAFLHIDLNCAYPEKAALEYFWPLLSPGALVLLDDYAYVGHDHQAKAIDATTHALGTQVVSLPTGQGLIVR
jgi:hypothetical protein